MTLATVLSDRRVPAILAGALILRVGVAAWPVMSHADELWQYLEPARHVVAGPWIETWDFRDGVRSWLLPLMLSGPMALGYAIAPFSRLDIFFARLFCVAVSMLGIAAGMALGWRISRRHGLVAGVATGGWFELVYLGPRTAAEPVATAFGLIAAYLLSGRAAGRSVLAGVLLGLACAIRVQ